MDTLNENELKMFVDSVRHYFKTTTAQEPQITSAFLGTGDVEGFEFNGIVSFTGSYNGQVIVSMPPRLLLPLLLVSALSTPACERSRVVRVPTPVVIVPPPPNVNLLFSVWNSDGGSEIELPEAHAPGSSVADSLAPTLARGIPADRGSEPTISPETRAFTPRIEDGRYPARPQIRRKT